MVTIDDTCPYRAVLDAANLPEEAWQKAPVPVAVEHLTLCQRDVGIEQLLTLPEEVPPIRCVRFRGRLYVHDGHRRALRAILRRQATIQAVVLNYDATRRELW